LRLTRSRNGMKFFTSDGGLDKADITDICSAAARDCEAAPGGHDIVTPAGAYTRPLFGSM
jgi:hypothetical protein